MIICPPPPRGEASVPASITARLVVRQSCKKVRLTTKFPSTHGRALGSPSGRAGAKRLRGEQKARLPSPSCRFAPCHLSRTRERQNVTCRLLPPTLRGRWPAGPERAGAPFCSPLSHRALPHPVPALPEGEPSARPWTEENFVVRRSFFGFSLPQTLPRLTQVHLAPPAGELPCRKAA